MSEDNKPKSTVNGSSSSSSNGTMSLMQRKSAAKKNKQHKALPKVLTTQEKQAKLEADRKQQKSIKSTDSDSDESFDEEIHRNDESNVMDEDEEEEGEAAWEKEAEIYNQKEASLAAARDWNKNQSNSFLSKITNCPRPSLWNSILIIIAISIVAGLCYLRFNDGLEMSDGETLETAPPDVDYYEVMGVSRTASMGEIIKAYRKLALTLHPDKAGPDCVDCAFKFDQLSSAYKTLSNKQKRAMYDSVETSFSELRSKTLDIHSYEEFQSIVLHSSHVWFIQIYTDWHRAAIRFAPVWEEISHKQRQNAKFARIHLATQRKIIHKLPVSVRQVPTVLCIVDGNVIKSKTFLSDTRENFKTLKSFIEEEFPSDDLTLIKSNINDVDSFINSDSSLTTILLFPSSKSMLKPSLSYRAISRRFSTNFKFGQVSPMPHLSKQKEEFMKLIQSKYGKFTQKSLPILLIKPAEIETSSISIDSKSTKSKPYWLSGDISGTDILLTKITLLQRRRITQVVDSSFWNWHCTPSTISSTNDESTSKFNQIESNTICSMLLLCKDSSKSTNSINAKEEYINSAKSILQKHDESKNKQYQFGIIDTSKSLDMNILCNQLESKNINIKNPLLIGTYDSNERTVIKEITSDKSSQIFKEATSFMNDLYSDQSNLQSIDLIQLPVHRQHKGVYRLVLPMTVLGHLYIDIPLTWCYTLFVISLIYLFRNFLVNHWPTFVFLIFASTFILPLIQFWDLLQLSKRFKM